MFQFFKGSFIVAGIGLLVATLVGGWAGLFSAAILAILEVSLSFDNAVVNATVLEDMDPKWQHRFLTWGMLIAVGGMRLVFPIAIVAITAGMVPWDVVTMALGHPFEYAHHLEAAHVPISMFGGAFLGMVFLDWLLDVEKENHWIDWLETPLAKIGKLDSVQIVVMSTAVLAVGYSLNSVTALVSGISGVLLYTVINTLSEFMNVPEAGNSAVNAGLMSFIYLEILDASFSFDGVIGAFAISSNILVIMVGLAIGAMFVRSLTLMLVANGTLSEYRYLEHGAHWGIGSLAVLMMVSVFTPVPELVTGLLSVGFITAALANSIMDNNQDA